MTSIKEIKCIATNHVTSLAEIGIRTTEQLLDEGSTSTGRMRIADETHIAETDILAWVHRIDIMRVKGITENLAELLCLVDVCTAPKLAFRRADSLYAALVLHATKQHAQKRIPSVNELEKLISHAKKMPKVVRH